MRARNVSMKCPSTKVQIGGNESRDNRKERIIKRVNN